jgi:hypothetical protein
MFVSYLFVAVARTTTRGMTNDPLFLYHCRMNDRRACISTPTTICTKIIVSGGSTITMGSMKYHKLWGLHTIPYFRVSIAAPVRVVLLRQIGVAWCKSTMYHSHPVRRCSFDSLELSEDDKNKRKLRDGESNPGLPRDRQGY